MSQTRSLSRAFFKKNSKRKDKLSSYKVIQLNKICNQKKKEEAIKSRIPLPKQGRKLTSLSHRFRIKTKLPAGLILKSLENHFEMDGSFILISQNKKYLKFQILFILNI